MKLSEINNIENKLKFSVLCYETLKHVPSDTSFRNWASQNKSPSQIYIPLLKQVGVTDV